MLNCILEESARPHANHAAPSVLFRLFFFNISPKKLKKIEKNCTYLRVSTQIMLHPVCNGALDSRAFHLGDPCVNPLCEPSYLNVLQGVAVCCIAVCCSVLQCVAVCCSVLQCVAVCCSVLQYVAV